MPVTIKYNGEAIRVTFHAVFAPNADAAVERAREMLLANVVDGHEYEYDCVECDDDFHDDHDDEPDRFIVSFCRDM
jgi:hypothetical protein